MTGLDQLQYLSWLLYLFVFVAVLARTIRRPTPAHLDMTLFFGAVAILIVMSTATAKLHVASPPWVTYLTGAAALSLGYPHAVQIVDDVKKAPVATQGPRIETHPRFPRRVNAGYMQVIDRANIRLRVWERGAGETLSCGTGACAAVVAGIRRGLVDSSVRVATRGGVLTIAWGGDALPVLMTGPAEAVFEGEWSVPER